MDGAVSGGVVNGLEYMLGILKIWIVVIGGLCVE